MKLPVRETTVVITDRLLSGDCGSVSIVLI